MSRYALQGMILLLALAQAVGCGRGSPAAPTDPPSTLLITTTSILDARVGTAFTQKLAATKGASPFTWGVASGHLPPGLVLNLSTGVLSGTPTQGGSFSYQLKVADSSSPAQNATASFTQNVSAVELDAYGGLVSMPSPNAPTPSHWRVEKFGRKWMFVDPANNAFYMNAIDMVGDLPYDCSNTYTQGVAAKYGDTCGNWIHYLPQLNRRLLAYGFNTVGTYSYGGSMPVWTLSGWPGDHSQPVKMPFLFKLSAGKYATYNPQGYAVPTTINFKFALSTVYTSGNYMPSIMPDWTSPYVYQWLDTALSQDYVTQQIFKSPYSNYLIGMAGDDGDQWYGMAITPDMATASGTTNPSLAWLVMSSSPQLVANVDQAQLYTDTTNYMKKMWHDQLVAKYGTISALNAAWGSNYTTFDSTGTRVTGESIGTGDGSTLSFSATLAHVPSYNSIQVFVNGTEVAGDIGQFSNWSSWTGKWLYGPHIDNSGCSINWSTGQITIKFTAGNAPASGAVITVNYIYDGWGSGTGLMDEDARASHQSWTGKDFTYLSDVNANLKADLSNLMYSIAHTYFANFKAKLEAHYPGTLFLGPDLSGWGAPPPKEILQAAGASDCGGPCVDAAHLDLNLTTQQKIDYIYTYMGDRPIWGTDFRHANPDSQLYAIPNPSDGVGFSTQGGRGQSYHDEATGRISWAYSNGSRPFVGTDWWQVNDRTAENADWGILTYRDNLYNGKEAITARGTDPWGYPTGGEDKNYGDLLDLVDQAHQFILSNVSSKQ